MSGDAPGLPKISRNFPESWGKNRIIAEAIKTELRRFCSCEDKYTWSELVDGSVRVRTNVTSARRSVAAEGCVIRELTLADESKVKICDFSKADLKLFDERGRTDSFKSFADLVVKMEREFGVWSDAWDDAWG